MTELELDSLHQRVLDLGSDVESALIKSKVHSYQCDRKIDRIRNYIENKNNLDAEEEVDTLAQVIGSNSNRLQAMEEKDFSTQIANLNDMLSATDDMLETMEEEHQEMIRELTDGISEQTEQIEGVQEMFGAIMNHKLITEEEYLALGTPDENTLYFTYE